MVSFFDSSNSMSCTDVDDLPIAPIIFVLDDSEEAIHALVNLCKATLLQTTVHQKNWGALNEVEDELRDGTRCPNPSRVQGIQPRPYPIERSEEREPEIFMLAIRPDHAVQELLGT